MSDTTIDFAPFVPLTALWVLVILTAMVLIYARTMRVEVTASSNRYSEQQASAIEMGAEAYITAAIDACKGDSLLVLQTPAEQIPVGNGYFCRSARCPRRGQHTNTSRHTLPAFREQCSKYLWTMRIRPDTIL